MRGPHKARLATFMLASRLASATIGPGACAVVSVESGRNNDFSILLLVDLPAGATLRATDYGWTAAGGFRTRGESVASFLHTHPTGQPLPAGSVLRMDAFLGALRFNNAGDQLFIYQCNATAHGGGHAGCETSARSLPNFLCALHFGSGAWHYDATDRSSSALPGYLQDGINAVALPSSLLSSGCRAGGRCRAWYAGPTSGTAAELRANINNRTKHNTTSPNATNVPLHTRFDILGLSLRCRPLRRHPPLWPPHHRYGRHRRRRTTIAAFAAAAATAIAASALSASSTSAAAVAPTVTTTLDAAVSTAALPAPDTDAARCRRTRGAHVRRDGGIDGLAMVASQSAGHRRVPSGRIAARRRLPRDSMRVVPIP